jgi:hypothetical protein
MEIVGNTALAVVILLAIWYLFKYFKTDRTLPVAKSTELLAHLRSLNLDDAVFTSDELFDKWSYVDGARALSKVRLENLEFSHIEILSRGRHPSADNLWLDYVFPISNSHKSKLKETRLRLGMGRVPVWKGDVRLAEVLNQAAPLNERIVAAEISEQYLSIVPQPLFANARIRVTFCLPTTEQFEIFQDLARQVKEVWDGEPD